MALPWHSIVMAYHHMAYHHLAYHHLAPPGISPIRLESQQSENRVIFFVSFYFCWPRFGVPCCILDSDLIRLHECFFLIKPLAQHLSSASGVLEPGSWSQDPGPRPRNPGVRITGPGLLVLIAGIRILVIGTQKEVP